MIRNLTYLAAFLCAAAIVPAQATAEEQSVDAILAEAQAYLHLSCTSLVAQYGADEEKILDIVELMIAVSLNNRAIDFLSLDLTDVEAEEIQAEFADQIGDACADDADQLLAGIIDHTVAELVQFY
ncbi:MAG: hypothetical protein ACPGNV_11835 [Mangrovicoccus sp.]